MRHTTLAIKWHRYQDIGPGSQHVSVQQRICRLGLYASLCGVLVLLVVPEAVQAQRKAKEPPPPPLDASIPATVAQCGMAYGNALAAQVRPAMTADLARATDAIGAPSSGWPGRWFTADPTGKQAKADALAAAEARTQERICTDRTKRAGRVSCAKWQDAQPAAPSPAVPPPASSDGQPVVVLKPAPVPPPADDELRDLKLLNGFVASKGQLIEFGRNGRLENLLKRSTGDLAAYVGQPSHPALCNGVPEMLEFHVDRMEAVQTRFTAVAELAARTRALAERRVASAIKLADADTRGKPLAGLVSAVSQLMLTADAARANAGQTDVLVQLRRLTEAAKSVPWIAEPAETQVAAAQALRALEAAFYADSQKSRAAAVDQTIFGAVSRIGDTHKVHCVCSE
jgi:hypothetical protein